MKYIKSILKRGLIGMVLGVFINQLFFVLIGITNNFKGEVPLKIQFHQFIISCVVGFYCSAASTIFSIEKWSKLKQTMIHLIIISIVYFPLAYYANWMPKNKVGQGMFIVTYFLIYILIWTFYKIYWHREIANLNKILKTK